MFKRTNYIYTTMILAMLAFAGTTISTLPANAGSTEQVKQETKEAYNAVKKYGFEKKEDAVNWLKKRQMALEVRIDKLKRKADNAGGKAKAKWTGMIAGLEKKKDAAADKAKDLSNAGKDAWEHTKDGAVSAYQELEQAFDDAVKSF